MPIFADYQGKRYAIFTVRPIAHFVALAFGRKISPIVVRVK